MDLRERAEMIRLTQAARRLEIAEWQYAWGQDVKFTHMDSCILVLGILVRDGQRFIVGVHMAQRDTHDAYVTTQDVGQIKWLLDSLGYVRGSIHVLGGINGWRAHNPQALDKLKADFGILSDEDDCMHHLAPGVYGGHMNNNEIEFDFG